MMMQLPKVLPAKSKQRRPIHLGRPADKVMRPRLKRLAGLVIPRVLGDVTIVAEHLRSIPVLLLTRQELTALQQEDALPRRSELVCESSPASAGADDDNVVVIHGDLSWIRTGWCEKVI